MAQCGDKPKRIAFGIAPLGIVSIGIVPMGVVSIGVVPMGVISLGVVGMGVLNACVVGMGVVVAGVHAMGISTLSPGGGHPHLSSGAAQQQLLAYPTAGGPAEAHELGCEGVHAMGDLWMPCAEHPRQH
jgi:Protein of unknown function./GLTT repeat (6 copies).